MSFAMRATQLSIENENLINIDSNMNQQAVTQQQLSSGYSINQPSDSPGEIGPILSTNALVARTQQYVKNAQDGVAFLGQANSVLNQITGLLDQVEQLVTELIGPSSQMGPGAAPPQEIAANLQGIYTNLQSLMNTTYLGIPVFGGTTGGNVAFDSAGNYVGTADPLIRTVAPGLSLQATAVGSQVFGSGASGLLGIVSKLVNDAQTDNVPQAQIDEGLFKNVFQQVQTQGTAVGAYYDAMNSALQSAQQTATTLQNQVSNIADTNIAQATTNLQQEQSTFQAALWATAQVTKYSLIQFVG